MSVRYSLKTSIKVWHVLEKHFWTCKDVFFHTDYSLNSNLNSLQWVPLILNYRCPYIQYKARKNILQEKILHVGHAGGCLLDSQDSGY